MVTPLYIKSTRAHSALSANGRHNRPITDDVSLNIAQRTTGSGAGILLDVVGVSHVVQWLIHATGANPDVEGYAQRPVYPGGVQTPLVVVQQAGAYADVLTIYVADGDVVVAITHFATHFANQGPQAVIRLTPHEAALLRDWLATWHLHGWPGVRHGAGSTAVSA